MTFLVVCLLTVATMFPVTGVVPVLKGLVGERYLVGDFLVSTFMSLNMLGALMAAPVCGWLSDRFGWTKRQLLIAAAADALLWLGMSVAPSFGLLAMLRFLEGVAHITALSMLLTIVSRSSGEYGKRSRMAAMGGSIIFGVAFGAPLGGFLGTFGVTVPLLVGAGAIVWSMVLCGVLSAVMFGPNFILVLSESRTTTRSSAIGGFNFIGSLGFLLGPLVAGGLLQFTSTRLGELARYRVTFGLGGLVEVLCVAGSLVVLWGRARRREPLL